MASEYLKWKYRDVKPEAPAELTQEEKRKNWWHYHKWYMAGALVLAGFCASLLWAVFGFGRIKPDYQVAYVSGNALPDDTATAIENAFAAFGEDLNGDGKVVVRLRQYTISESDPQMSASIEVTLVGDLLECESYFFLLDDPAWFQANYHMLCRLDGSLPEDDDYSAEGTYLPWTSCPALAGADLGSYSQEILGGAVSGSSGELTSGLALARRGFWTEKTVPYPEGCEKLWNKLTEGAVS